MSRVLVIDDEPAIRDAVGYALRNEGFEVEAAADGEAGLRAALEKNFDVVVLDLMLPRMSGMEVCRRLRTESAVPVIMLTAKGAELDRVLGLEIGADDYVSKPFSMAELSAESGRSSDAASSTARGAASVITVGEARARSDQARGEGRG